MRRCIALAFVLVACLEDRDAPCLDILAFADEDGDGFGAEEIGVVCALSDGEVELGTDCDDDDAAVFPGAPEECNGKDDDCTDGPDQGLPGTRVWYSDEDGDGFGAQYPAKVQCGDPGPGWAAEDGDCDDGDDRANPARAEVCNGIDDDCDDMVDTWDSSLDPDTLERYWADRDFDGFGDPNEPTRACALPGGYAANDGDCAPEDPLRHPDAVEICNDRLDDDCDGRADDQDSDTDPASMSPFFVDRDLDGWGTGAGEPACRAGAGRAANDLDCDDRDPTLNLDDRDADTFTSCSGDCDDRDPRITPVDTDGDGFSSCDLPVGDCEPFDGDVFPGALEVAGDHVDQDCDAVDDCFVDLDRDGYGREQTLPGLTLDCSAPLEASVGGDCDDGDRDITIERPWYQDFDGDGFGAGPTTGFGCLPPNVGDKPTNTDCDDDATDTNPDADEVCDDAVDQDCDGSLLCCPIPDELAASGWPAQLDFAFCWFSVNPCPFPPVGATFAISENGGFNCQGSLGTWVVDEDACNLALTFSVGTTYTGEPSPVPGCYQGTMESTAGDSGTWTGCLR